jgi:serine/threonine protein kinase
MSAHESREPRDDKHRHVRVGKYRVLSHLASGGMGAVYKARDEELGRLVALKILVRALADKPERVDRFRREARHAARLQHENIVTIYEFGEFEDLHFLALEYVDGVDLLHYISDKGRIDAQEACAIVTQAACALEHSFEQGIIHRDIKPSNLLITRRKGELLVKLTDLGIARDVAPNDAARMTGAGMIMGTIDYLAPEQARDSSNADIRSDIYSLGCTLYEMLAGKPPFEGSLTELVYKHSEEMPVEIATIRSDVPPGLGYILRKMMAKKPEDRYQTPTELLTDLRRVDELDRPRKKLAPPVRPKDDQAAKGLQETLKRKARTEIVTKQGTDEQTRLDRDTAQITIPSPQHYRIALGQFEKASEALEKGSYDYAIPLLLNCCMLDPANLKYRRALRKAESASYELHPHVNVATTVKDLFLKAKLKAAKRSGAFGKVLEYSEKILVHEPHDFGVQFDGALAAKEIGLLNSAIWMLERLRKQQPKSAPVIRELAAMYEEREDYGQAVAAWEQLAEIAPADGEARVKLQELAARQAIHRGGYGELLERK